MKRGEVGELRRGLMRLESLVKACWALLDRLEPAGKTLKVGRGRGDSAQAAAPPSPPDPLAEALAVHHEVADRAAGFAGRKRLGRAGPGYVGAVGPVGKRRGRPPGSKPDTRDPFRHDPLPPGKPPRKTPYARRGRGGGWPSPMRPDASTPSPDWVPVPDGDGRFVELDGGGEFETAEGA